MCPGGRSGSWSLTFVGRKIAIDIDEDAIPLNY
jgi:hypothetical protein